MPVPIIVHALSEGLPFLQRLYPVFKVLAFLGVVALLKIYFGGARNTAERNMHSKVVLMTGGTSGIGAAVAHDLASRGAQLVLLTRYPLNDPFLVDFIMDLRSATANELITAEQVDLASLHSIRQFATKWVDNAPPRRLDMIILCANEHIPRSAASRVTDDGVEAMFGVNYLANFHLLSILSPALRAQPADRDVRVIMGTCSSYLSGSLPATVPRPKAPKKGEKSAPPSSQSGSARLALMTFAQAFQKHLSSYKRPDKAAMNTRVVVVDPGFSRTPSRRRALTRGTLWGLAAYLLLWPMWWLVLKSPQQGAQTFLWAAMEDVFGRGEGGYLIKECAIVGKPTDAKGGAVHKPEIGDEAAQKRLWELSDKAIELLEKEGARRRATEKAEAEELRRAREKAEETGKKQPGSRRSKKDEKKA